MMIIRPMTWIEGRTGALVVTIRGGSAPKAGVSGGGAGGDASVHKALSPRTHRPRRNSQRLL